MFDLDTSLGSLFSLGWRAAWKAAANDVWAFERLKNDADWHAEQVRAHVAQLEAAARPTEDALRAHIAELEAATRPIPFAEHERIQLAEQEAQP